MNKIMTKEEAYLFIKNLGCRELYQELADMILYSRQHPERLKFPNFIHGVCQSLLYLGYDSQWVMNEFKDELAHYYVSQTVALCSQNPVEDMALPFVIGAHFQR